MIITTSRRRGRSLPDQTLTGPLKISKPEKKPCSCEDGLKA